VTLVVSATLVINQVNVDLYKMKKALGETQTLLAGGAKNFRPAADALPGGTGRPKFNQLEMVTTFTDKPSLVKIDARTILSYRDNRPTNKHTHINRQDRLQYTAPLSLARIVKKIKKNHLMRCLRSAAAGQTKRYSGHGDETGHVQQLIT